MHLVLAEEEVLMIVSSKRAALKGHTDHSRTGERAESLHLTPLLAAAARADEVS